MMIKTSRVVTRLNPGVVQVEAATKALGSSPMTFRYVWSESGVTWFASLNEFSAEEVPEAFIPSTVVDVLKDSGNWNMKSGNPWSTYDYVEFVDMDPVDFMEVVR